MSVSHIAGLIVKIDGRVIQRCAVCGEKLIDSLNSASCDGSPMPVWQENRFVQVDGNYWSLLPESNELPVDHCLPLVEY